MYSGIIEEMGVIADIAPKGDGFLFSIKNKNFADQVKNGSSVGVSGICLTVVEVEDDIMNFEVMPETLRKTTLGERKVGDEINLELSLRVGDRIDGHFVFGHVDGVGEVVDIEQEGDNWLMSIKIPNDLKIYLAPQGSISVDGVSLTVARIKDNIFTVSLIEYTMKVTTLGKLKVGGKVNIECDMLAKYVNSQLSK